MNIRKDTLVAVSKISELITMTLDTAEILTKVVEITAGIMKVDVCSIYLLNTEDGYLELKATKGLRTDAVGNVRIPPGEGITGRVAKQGRTFAVSDVTRDRRNKYFPITGEDEYRSLMSAPLKFQNELIGAINVQTKKARTYQEHERRLLKTIAQQVSGAIHNARLYENVLAAKRELEETHERLVESEKMAALGRLAATLSHELRNPLAGLKGVSQLLSRKIPPKDTRQPYLSIMLEEIERLDTIVEDLLHFARPRELKLEYIDGNQILEDMMMLHAEDFEQRGIIVRKRLSKLPNVNVDRDKLKQVFVNILLNARDAMPGGGELLVSSGVTLRFNHSGDMISFQFRDSGDGIPDEVLRNIFEPFYTTKADGVGLGLAVCKTIVEEHNGYITISSGHEAGDGGTVVTVYLPLTNR